MLRSTRSCRSLVGTGLLLLLHSDPSWAQEEPPSAVEAAVVLDEQPVPAEQVPVPVSAAASTGVASESARTEPAPSNNAPSHGVAAPSGAVSAGTDGSTLHGGASSAPSGAPAVAPARTVTSAGIDPSVPQYDDGANVVGANRAAGDWGMEFHGFLRAPMRLGIGPRNDGQPGTEEHSPPRVPDLSFTDWTYTHNVPGPWTQLLLSYGNGLVKGTVGIASFNHTTAGYRNLQANLGINEAFVTLNFPDTFGRHGGLLLNVRSFSNRYGTSGEYNAGRYNTYLFGRTRVAGETLTAGLFLSPDLTLTLEHGVGAKLDVIPAETTDPRPDYLPYGGPEPQGTSWVHHGHATLGIHKTITLGGHFLQSRSSDDRQIPGTPSTPGRMTITGGELRFTGKAYGHGYVGFSHIDAKEIMSLADTVEVLHSFAGWNFKNNYFGQYDPRTGTSPPDTSGKVNTLLFQYDLSLGALARLPARFKGNGPDLNVSVFGMFNNVNSETNSHNKFKWGADAVYTPFSVLGVGLRYDLVQPDLADRDQSFAVLSPKLVFTTQFVTKERVTLQYSHYFLADKAYPAHPYSNIDEADPHVIMINGQMWW